MELVNLKSVLVHTHLVRSLLYLRSLFQVAPGQTSGLELVNTVPGGAYVSGNCEHVRLVVLLVWEALFQERLCVRDGVIELVNLSPQFVYFFLFVCL